MVTKITIGGWLRKSNCAELKMGQLQTIKDPRHTQKYLAKFELLLLSVKIQVLRILDS